MRNFNSVFAITIAISTLSFTGCGSSSNSVDQIKVGLTEMLSTTNQLKQAIDAGDQATVKSTAPKLEETWKTIEDGVKPRSSDLYDKIEASLNPEVAGSQAGQLDKQMLGKLNDQLTQTLNELLQKI